MANLLVWPWRFLKPAQISANLPPFSRSGGRALDGDERVIRTDRGFWRIKYKGIALGVDGRPALWNALRTSLGGRAGALAVPVFSTDTAPWVTATGTGPNFGKFVSTHSDGSSLAVGSLYQTCGINVEMAAAAAIGATSVTLRLVTGIDSLVGVRFSWRHALYETGALAAPVDGAEWTVAVGPAIRAPISAGAQLEFDWPTCRVRLADDRGMDSSLSVGRNDRVDVEWVEDTAYWNDLAAAA